MITANGITGLIITDLPPMTTVSDAADMLCVECGDVAVVSRSYISGIRRLHSESEAMMAETQDILKEIKAARDIAVKTLKKIEKARKSK